MQIGVGIGIGKQRVSSAWVPAGPLNVTISGETFTVTGVQSVGYDMHGLPYAVLPSGTATLTRSTAPATQDGLAINGAMKNPQRRAVAGQAFDARMSNYSAATGVTFPLTVTAGDIVVCAISRAVSLPDSAAKRRGCCSSYPSIQILSAAPSNPSQYSLPAYIGYTGRGVPVGYTVDIDAFVATLPSRDASAHPKPAMADLLAAMGRHNPLIRFIDGDTPEAYEAHHIQGFGGFIAGVANSNYGQNSGSIMHAAFMFLTSNAATTAEKKVIAKWALRHGIDAVDPCIGDAGNVTSNGGGHTQYQLLYEMLALSLTGRSALIPTIGTIDSQNPTRQPFKVTAAHMADLVPHVSGAKPYPFRQRTIPTGGVSALALTVPTSYGGSSDDSDSFFAGYRVTLVSDGTKSGLYVSSPKPGFPGETNPYVDLPAGVGTVVLNIDAQPSPAFAATNVVYLKPPFTHVEGMYSWAIAGSNLADPTKGWHKYDAHHLGHGYYILNQLEPVAMIIRLMGWYNVAFEAIEGLCAATNTPNYPAAGAVFTRSNDTIPLAGTPNWGAAFWDSHAVDDIPTVSPKVSSASIAVTLSTAVLSWSTDYGAGTANWMIDTNATRTAAQIITGGGTRSGSVVPTAKGAQPNIVASGLADGTYYWHIVHQKTGANPSNVAEGVMSVAASPFAFVSNSALVFQPTGAAVFNMGTVAAGTYVVQLCGRANGGTASIPPHITVNGTNHNLITGSGLAPSGGVSMVAAYLVTLASSYSGNWTLPASADLYNTAIALTSIGSRSVISTAVASAHAGGTQTIPLTTLLGDQIILWSTAKNANASADSPASNHSTFAATSALACQFATVAAAVAGAPRNYTLTIGGFNEPVSGGIVLRLP